MDEIDEDGTLLRESNQIWAEVAKKVVDACPRDKVTALVHVPEYIESLCTEYSVLESAFHLAVGELSTYPPHDKAEPDFLCDRILREAKTTVSTRLSKLHPGCRGPWEKGLTSYPIGEHIRDCDLCQEWNRHPDRHSDSADTRQCPAGGDHSRKNGGNYYSVCKKCGTRHDPDFIARDSYL